MTSDEMQWLKQLYQANDLDATVANFYLNTDSRSTHVGLLRAMVIQLLADKGGLQEENKKMASILKNHNLYHELLE
jgi:hypothetical protein